MTQWIETPEGMWAYLKTPYMAEYYQKTNQTYNWNTFLKNYLRLCTAEELVKGINNYYEWDHNLKDPEENHDQAIARYQEILQLIHERKHNERN